MVVTDCLSAVQAFEAGALEHDLANEGCAGLWRSVASALGDRRLSLVWMPAHCGLGDAGTLCRSDDQPLSALDIRANSRADTLARRVAESSCVLSDVKKAILQQQEFVFTVARGLALVCAAAQAFDVGEGLRIRDVAPLARPVRAVTSASSHQGAPARGTPMGHMAFVEVDGRLRCARCGRSSLLPDKRFLRQPCRGMPVPVPCAAGSGRQHLIQSSGTVRWCSLCGAYSETRVGALATECPGRPPNAGRRDRLRRLLLGRHPRLECQA